MKKIMISALMSIVLVGCNKDNITDASSQGDVKAALYSETAVSRVLDGYWEKDDQIGVYQIYAASTELSSESICGSSNNVLYYVNHEAASYNQDNMYFYPEDNKHICFPGAEEVEFIAYYPYSTSAIGADYKYELSVLEQSNPANIDFLYAKTAAQDYTTNDVNLDFEYILPRIVINLTKGTGAKELPYCTIKLKTTHNTTGKINLFDGVADDSQRTLDTVTLTAYSVNAIEGKQHTLLLFPSSQAMDNKLDKLYFYMDGNDDEEKPDYIWPDDDSTGGWVTSTSDPVYLETKKNLVCNLILSASGFEGGFTYVIEEYETGDETILDAY